MRILFVSAHKYMPEWRGGMEINTHDLIGLMRDKGEHCSVYAGFIGGGWLGLQARAASILKRKSWIKSTYSGYAVYRSFDYVDNLAEVIKVEAPDCIILQGGDAYYDILDRLAFCAPDIPVVSYFHTPDPLRIEKKKRLPNKLRYVANSKFTESLHADKEIDLILPPIFFKQKYFVANPTRKFATLVNPLKYKGVERAIWLAANNPKVDFQFVVNNKSKIEAVKEEFRLPHNVTVAGPFSDMRQVYGASKLILTPSLWKETWGRINTEAQFSGIPVLSSNTGGIPESVGPGGICLPPDAADVEWQKAFTTLWFDNYADYSKKASEYSTRPQVDPNWNVESLLQLIADM